MQAIVVAPNPVVMLEGDTAQVAIRLENAAGRVVTASMVTYLTAPTVVTMLREGGYRLKGLGPGTATLTVRADTLVREVPVRVIRPPVRSIAVSPRVLALSSGGREPLAVETTDSVGRRSATRAVNFRPLDTAVAVVTASGEVRARQAGTTLVVVTPLEAPSGAPGAAMATPADTVRLTVRPQAAGVGDPLLVYPRAVTMGVGAAGTLEVNAELAALQSAGVETVGWQSDHPEIAMIEDGPSGGGVRRSPVLRAVAPGSATITVRAEEAGTVRTGSVSVTVRPVAAPGAFHITTEVVSVADTAVAAALSRATARWESAITGDLPDVRVTTMSGACGRGTPAVARTVDDLHVLVVVDSVDGAGAVIGWATPCVVRVGSALTALGVLTIDRDDLSWLRDWGVLDAVVTHEIGHLLGIGQSWNTGGRWLMTGTATDDPRYWGAAGRDAVYALGLSDSPRAGVSVENTGRVGTREMHWRAATFGQELMTGWLAARSPLSAVTVEALRDLGYQVDAAAATLVTPQSLGLRTAPGVSMPGGGHDLRLDGHERLDTPRFEVTPEGALQPRRRD